MGTISAKPTAKDIELLYRTAQIATETRAAGNQPFGALLTDATGTIILEQGNVVVTKLNACGHAETMLLMWASQLYSRDFLATCSLYASVEPCAMCSGALYWTNVGRLVYGISGRQLQEFSRNNTKHPTLDLPCRQVLDRGQKDIVVVGPVDDPDLIKRISKDHVHFWA